MRTQCRRKKNDEFALFDRQLLRRVVVLLPLILVFDSAVVSLLSRVVLMGSYLF